ncbi:MAG: acetyl-CoA C-acetyltransferase [Actinomycetota bacterium]|jgi:acetyl-CoA C-acetyltransferase|nr:acetyl-CoA C-acetyltransferase [Actinomycetota bacterium]MEA2486918.1 acetyl-CoA C-acetyltransferase [Actinomycetota bacterium]
MTSVIVSAARTAIGKFQGAVAGVPAVDLGAAAIRGAVERSGVDTEQIDYVIMGQVLQGGAGQITARQAAVKAGVPKSVPAITINKVCLSGLNAIALADQLIRAGEISVAIAGGMESMDQAPYLLPKARTGFRMGDGKVVDSMIHDGLWDAFTNKHMGDQSDDVNQEFKISREAQDAWAARSHQRAAKAIDDGRFAEEIVPVWVPQRKGDPVAFEVDEGVRADATAESLAKLKPAFRPDGTITAGNASQISDGGAALVVMSTERASELGLEPIAEIVAHGMSADEPPYLHTVPALALQSALKKAGMSPSDLDLVEINEAFAAVALHSAHMLFNGSGEDKVNVNGGAVALGHPIGCTGARLTVTLLHELKRRGGGIGAAALCGGGGQGDAVIFRVAG